MVLEREIYLFCLRFILTIDIIYNLVVQHGYVMMCNNPYFVDKHGMYLWMMPHRLVFNFFCTVRSKYCCWTLSFSLKPLGLMILNMLLELG